MSDTLAAFLSGAFAAGYIVIGAIFLRFWMRSVQGLFLAFAAAFALLAAGQTAAALMGDARESEPAVYLFRLLAFGVISIAIARKNFRARWR